MKDKINYKQAKNHIKFLDEKFDKIATEWDGHPHECTILAIEEWDAVNTIRYFYKGFIYDYNPDDFSDSMGREYVDEEEFDGMIIDESNYNKADAVAFDIKCELCEYIQAEIDNMSIDDLLTQLVDTVRADEHYLTLCENQSDEKGMHQDFLNYCEQLHLTSLNSNDAVEEVEKLIDELCAKIKAQ